MLAVVSVLLGLTSFKLVPVVTVLVQEGKLLAVAGVQSWKSVPGGRLAMVRVPLAPTRLEQVPLTVAVASYLVQVPLLAAAVVAAVVQEGRLLAVEYREVRPRQLWW